MAWFIWRTQKNTKTMTEWHIITGEYPPQPGGVSDYTRIVARELAAAGDGVHVWCPQAAGATSQEAGVIVHRDLGNLAPTDFWRVGQRLKQFAAPRWLLVQWVPHGYGYKSLNVPFCLWLWLRAKLHGDQVELMVHEAYLSFSRTSWKQNAAALVHRLMTVILLNCASRVWMSIPGWEPKLAPYALGRKLQYVWLPIPSNIPIAGNESKTNAIRERYAADGQLLLGHFGTFCGSITGMLASTLPALLRERSDLAVLLMGRKSDAFRAELARLSPDIAARLHATGGLESESLSQHISACDAMLQPYPDGISSRRTSAMASLIHGKPLITTSGELTEALWAQSAAVALAPANDVRQLKEQSHQLLDNVKQREQLGAAARLLYEEHFDVRRVVARLRQTEPDTKTALELGEPVATDY